MPSSLCIGGCTLTPVPRTDHDLMASKSQSCIGYASDRITGVSNNAFDIATFALYIKQRLDKAPERESKQAIEARGCRLLFLPASSPDL